MFFIRKLQIVRNVKVQVAILVHVKKTGPGPHLKSTVYTRLFCHIGKGTIAVIAIQYVRSVIIQVNIRIPVIVVIANGNTQAISTVTYTCLFRYIDKFPIPFIAVKRILR